MSNTLPSARGLPAYPGSVGYVTFRVGMDGRIRMSRGPALESIGWTEDAMERTSVYDLYEANPELAAAYHRLFRGHRVATILTFAGRRWFFDASPIVEDGVQTGIMGAAWLESEEDAPAQPTTAANQVWIGPNGTTWHETDHGVLRVEREVPSVFEALQNAGAIRLLRPSPAAAPPPPRLRLLPR